MATTYTTYVGLPKPAFGDRNWHTPILAAINGLDALAPVGALAVQLKEVPSASRNVKVSAGAYIKADGTFASYAGTSSFTVTASGTRYLYLTDGGTLTDGTAWPGTDHVRLAVVVTGASTITSITDARAPFRSTGAGGGSYLPLSGGTMSGDTAYAAGADLIFDASSGSKIGTATTQKIGFWNATPVVQPASANQAALTDSTGGDVSDSTLGDADTSSALTVSSGGSSSTVLSAITLSTSMTGSTGGTADGAWQSIPDPADTPASADALRDDLVANALPAIRNNLAETAAELALVRSALLVVRDSIASLGDAVNLAIADISTSNDNVAKVAELVNALRSAAVSLGTIKGSA